MKKKKAVTILIILIILIPVSFAVTDRIRYENGKSAIFVRKFDGGEFTEYKGFGYSIEYYYPQTTLEDESIAISSVWVWFWEY